MSDFLEIACLNTKELEALEKEIESRIEEKKKSGLMTDKEVREIEEMRLRPLADLLDVQSVYEALRFDD